MPTGTWDSTSLAAEDADFSNIHLLTHAKVYALADKYAITGLKALACSKFATQMAAHHGAPEAALAMQEAYESTVDSDRGLRDVVIATFRAHPELARRNDVCDMVRETPSLAWELFRVGWGLPVTG